MEQTIILSNLHMSKYFLAFIVYSLILLDIHHNEMSVFDNPNLTNCILHDL